MNKRDFLIGSAKAFAAGLAFGQGCAALAAEPAPEPGHFSVTSADGTAISYLRLGQGPSLVVAHGGLEYAEDWLAVASAMAGSVTSYLMDRRGRGESGTHRPGHSVEREIEDIQAVMRAAGPGAALLGHSSGGVFALEAALRTHIEALILYEPAIPYRAGADAIARMETAQAARAARDTETLSRAHDLVEAGKLDEALTLALELAGASEADLAQMRAAPNWPELTRRTRAWLGDFEAMGPLTVSLAASRFANIRSRTLLVTGSASPEVLRDTVAALGVTLPGSRVLDMRGQNHIAHLMAPQLLAGGIADFLAS